MSTKKVIRSKSKIVLYSLVVLFLLRYSYQNFYTKDDKINFAIQISDIEFPLGMHRSTIEGIMNPYFTHKFSSTEYFYTLQKPWTSFQMKFDEEDRLVSQNINFMALAVFEKSNSLERFLGIRKMISAEEAKQIKMEKVYKLLSKKKHQYLLQLLKNDRMVAVKSIGLIYNALPGRFCFIGSCNTPP